MGRSLNAFSAISNEHMKYSQCPHIRSFVGRRAAWHSLGKVRCLIAQWQHRNLTDAICGEIAQTYGSVETRFNEVASYKMWLCI